MRSGVSLGLILLIVRIVLLLGVLPSLKHSRQWGYGPSGALSLIPVVFVCLLLFEVVHWRIMHISY